MNVLIKSSQLLEILLKAPKKKLSKAEILKRAYGDISSVELSELIEIFQEAKIIRREIKKDTIYIILEKKIAKRYNKIIKEAKPQNIGGLNSKDGIFPCVKSHDHKKAKCGPIIGI